MLSKVARSIGKRVARRVLPVDFRPAVFRNVKGWLNPDFVRENIRNSPLLNRDDLDTAILFGDASSATVLFGESHFDCSRSRLFRPELSAKGEDGSTLKVPFRDGGFIEMQAAGPLQAVICRIAADENCRQLTNRMDA